MGMSAWKRAGVSLTAVAVVAGVAGCQDGDGAKKAADAPVRGHAQGQEAVTKVIRAAYLKTADARSAKVRMSLSMPAAVEGGGGIELTGIQGWNPGVMDITVKGSMLGAAGPGAPEQTRMILLDDALYMDVGAKQAAEMDGKRWMKLDLEAAAQVGGGKGLQKQMTGGLENMNQDPAQQLALLLKSPDLKHLGAEKVDGTEAQHYKGTLTFEDMLDANEAYDDLIPAKDRETVIAGAKKAGIEGYDTELWVDEDGYPVKMAVGMTTPQGTMSMTAHYSDYGTRAAVQAPPAKDTVDLFAMLKDLGGGSSGAGRS
ncbi:hypothetical protein [Streptomyces sp. NPDC048338]|uniref:hypothetical protein n=1 Tax=Streptomyces sp. NPDC048338 TaxID=3365536 RepID=UPI0037123F87